MSKATILLVDDDRLVLVTLARELSKAGYAILQAASAQEAIALCDAKRPDMGIFDIRMPEISGITAAQELYQKYALPFMILSAYSDTDTVTEAIHTGALCYLVKPIDVGQMIPTIESSLQRAKDLRQLKDSEQKLITALQDNRDTSAAIGILMERYRVTNHEAFTMLRSEARSQRKKITDIAQDIVTATEALNQFPSSK
jgi:AmiR/NasT family two-component response regulator